MPLYEYECEACGHRFEVIQKFSDAAIDACPSCGGRVRKLLSSSAIQFKGSGWYVTDYAKKQGSKEGSTEGSKEGSTEGSKEGSKEGQKEGQKEGPKESSKPGETTSPKTDR